jgi:ABC-type transporter Mla MlaB component
MAAPGPQTVVLALEGPLDRSEVPGVYERAAALLMRSTAATVVCDLSRAAATVVSVDALARVTLAARRRGCETHLQGASDELLELLDLVGLRELFLD